MSRVEQILSPPRKKFIGICSHNWAVGKRKAREYAGEYATINDHCRWHGCSTTGIRDTETGELIAFDDGTRIKELENDPLPIDKRSR